jgi:hypothetical protein
MNTDCGDPHSIMHLFKTKIGNETMSSRSIFMIYGGCGLNICSGHAGLY